MVQSLADPSRSSAPNVPEVENTENDTATLVDVDSPHVSSVPSNFEDQSVKTSTQADRIEREDEERSRAEKAKREAKEEAERAKNKARGAGSALSKNKDNPVVIGNALLLVLAAAGLGFGAYKKQAAGTLTWKVAGIWSGGVGAVAFGDYFVSKYVDPCSCIYLPPGRGACIAGMAFGIELTYCSRTRWLFQNKYPRK